MRSSSAPIRRRRGSRDESGGSFDGDATSMAVEAGRSLMRTVEVRPDTVLFARVTPPYLDKTNATVVHAALDRATPGQTIMVVHLADGCTASVFRTTAAITEYAPASTVADQVAAGDDGLTDNDFLTWRGLLDREPPRRPDPESPVALPTFRSERWKYAFVGSRDRTSGAVHLPPQRVAAKGGAVDDMELVPVADVPATVVTSTIDRLRYSLAPPAIAVVIDFDGGGRLTCQLNDASTVAGRAWHLP